MDLKFYGGNLYTPGQKFYILSLLINFTYNDFILLRTMRKLTLEGRQLFSETWIKVKSLPNDRLLKTQ